MNWLGIGGSIASILSLTASFAKYIWLTAKSSLSSIRRNTSTRFHRELYTKEIAFRFRINLWLIDADVSMKRVNEREETNQMKEEQPVYVDGQKTVDSGSRECRRVVFASIRSVERAIDPELLFFSRREKND